MLNKHDNIVYDYIITGAGCAGLSFLYRLLKDPVLQHKKILVLDKAEKNTNDRTWCYWEKGTGIFEPIVSHQWRKLEFKTENFKKTFNLKQFSYKMISALDFYNFVQNFAKKFENVSFKFENIVQIDVKDDLAIVKTDDDTYSAVFVFNSTSLFNPKMDTSNSLLQHFEGWVIKTKRPIFDKEIGTLMDFTVSQNNGTTFMYVLPTDANEALVEYTLFTEKLLDKVAYTNELERYIKEDLHIEAYEILHKEFGIIPMSLAKFNRNPKLAPQIINIGTAGGYTKASSGYTFQFIQKNVNQIVQNLKAGKSSPSPKMTFRDKMYEWYDRTLLEVMITKKLGGKEIFSMMFKKLSMDRIFRFLANESSLLDDIMIMSSLQIKPFLIAGIKKLKN